MTGTVFRENEWKTEAVKKDKMKRGILFRIPLELFEAFKLMFHIQF